MLGFLTGRKLNLYICLNFAEWGNSMGKEKVIRFICDMLSVIFLLGFVFGLFWYLHGSFEMVPTEEQQEKARIGAICFMIVTGAPCGICIAVRRAMADIIENNRCKQRKHFDKHKMKKMIKVLIGG